MADKDDMDIINMSLGNGPGWPEHPLSQAVNKLAFYGRILVIAGGNDGSSVLYHVIHMLLNNYPGNVRSCRPFLGSHGDKCRIDRQ